MARRDTSRDGRSTFAGGGEVYHAMNAGYKYRPLIPKPSVSGPLFHMAYSIIAMLCGIAMMAMGVWYAILVIIVAVSWVFMSKVHYDLARWDRAKAREQNIWIAIDNIVNSKFPEPSKQLAEYEGVKVHEASAVVRPVKGDTPPDPNSKRSQKKRERAARRAAVRQGKAHSDATAAIRTAVGEKIAAAFAVPELGQPPHHHDDCESPPCACVPEPMFVNLAG